MIAFSCGRNRQAVLSASWVWDMKTLAVALGGSMQGRPAWVRVGSAWHALARHRVWDMDSLECVRVLEGHNEAVLALAVGPTFLVSGSYDTTVRFWGLDTLRCIRCATSSSAPPPLHPSMLSHCCLRLCPAASLHRLSCSCAETTALLGRWAQPTRGCAVRFS